MKWDRKPFIQHSTRPTLIYKEAFVAVVMGLNVVMMFLLLNRGLPFWPGRPDPADMPTTVCCLVTAVVTTLWAVAYARER